MVGPADNAVPNLNTPSTMKANSAWPSEERVLTPFAAASRAFLGRLLAHLHGLEQAEAISTTVLVPDLRHRPHRDLGIGACVRFCQPLPTAAPLRGSHGSGAPLSGAEVCSVLRGLPTRETNLLVKLGAANIWDDAHQVRHKPLDRLPLLVLPEILHDVGSAAQIPKTSLCRSVEVPDANLIMLRRLAVELRMCGRCVRGHAVVRHLAKVEDWKAEAVHAQLLRQYLIHQESHGRMHQAPDGGTIGCSEGVPQSAGSHEVAGHHVEVSARDEFVMVLSVPNRNAGVVRVPSHPHAPIIG
mmetsp:Transcript_75945/g.200063  ORF Transcript_75945/g.200063 Transcript_75945/m.200063 type:complete len:299 (+) Transcript_75945:1-897(+)